MLLSTPQYLSDAILLGVVRPLRAGLQARSRPEPLNRTCRISSRASRVNGFRASVEARERCCTTRKVEPLRRALAGATGWVAGLRAEQSSDRAVMPYAFLDQQYHVIKVNPLLDWTRKRVVAYLHDRGIPCSPLHARGFVSIGCEPCTRAVTPGGYERAGRWWWEREEKKECGLHTRASESRPAPMNTGVIDRFTEVFTRYIDSGFGLLSGEVAFLASTLIVIDVTLAGLFWAWAADEDVIAHLVKKTLYVGFFALTIGNFNALAQVVFNSFTGLGLKAAGSGLSADQFLQPGSLAQVGVDAGKPILQAAGQLMASSPSSRTSSRFSCC
jgi:hypothetical protein